MTDQELLAYEREHHDDPDMTLEKATETQRLALHCWASGAATRRRTGLPSRRRDVALRQTLFPCDSAVLESKGERDWKAPRRRLVHLTPNKARGHAGPYGSNEVPASAPRSHATDCRWDRFGPLGRTVIPVGHSSAPCASEALQ